MKFSYIIFFWFLLFLIDSEFLFAQNERKNVRDGNKLYNNHKYDEAEASYKKALDKNKVMKEAVFNLGNAIYKQGGRMDEAISLYQQIASSDKDSLVQAKALHNMGNIFLSQEKYKEAAEAFKNSLKKNPIDQDTRYNLAYANLKLRQQQNQKDNNKKDKDEKQDQEKKENEKKNQDENKKEEGEKNPDDKGQKNEEKEGGKEGEKKQQIKGTLKKEDAEKLLQALQNEEQKTNQKMMQKQAKPVNGKILKDW